MRVCSERKAVTLAVGVGVLVRVPSSGAQRSVCRLLCACVCVRVVAVHQEASIILTMDQRLGC